MNCLSIIDYPNYTISNNGIITNIKTERILKQTIQNGYYTIKLSSNHSSKMFYIHILVATLFIKNDLNKRVVNHKDGDKLNNNYINLEWVTYSENIQHAYDNNLISEQISRDIKQYNDKGDLIRIFKNKKEVQEHLNLTDGEYNGMVYKKFKSKTGIILKIDEKLNINLSEYTDLKNFENIYMIDKNGNIFSKLNKKCIKPSLSLDGYNVVNLTNNSETSSFFLHRLLAIQFIPNNNLNKTIINHKDGIKTNNDINNLEWCTHSENMAHFANMNLAKKVIQLSLNNDVIEKFNSIVEASNKTNIIGSNISRVCNGIRQTAGGFKWKFDT